MIHKAYKSRVSDVNDKGVVVVAANAFNNEDSQGDVSLKGSFKKTIENIKNIYWYKNHNTNETLGVIKRLWEDDRFLNSEMHFNLDKEISRNMYSDYKFFTENDSTVKHSVGVSTYEDKFEVKDNVRYVKEWRLWEVSSLTKWPSNENTPTHAVKSYDNFDLQKYYDWMSKEGMHTDAFIKEVEQLLLNISESQSSTPQKKETESNSTLIESINNIKL